MPKPVALTPDLMDAPPVAPQAAAAARGTAPKEAAARAPKAEQIIPLQLRLPRNEVKAIKIAAAEREQTLSEFMLACFHVRMQKT